MAKKAKSRTIAVRLISMAMTGYYRTMVRSSYAPPSEYAQIRPRGEEEGLISGSDKGWKGRNDLRYLLSRYLQRPAR
ncbi:hypothetical protein V6Z93_010673 [Aspergillus fumigatus]